MPQEGREKRDPRSGGAKPHPNGLGAPRSPQRGRRGGGERGENPGHPRRECAPGRAPEPKQRTEKDAATADTRQQAGEARAQQKSRCPRESGNTGAAAGALAPEAGRSERYVASGGRHKRRPPRRTEAAQPAPERSKADRRKAAAQRGEGQAARTPASGRGAAIAAHKHPSDEWGSSVVGSECGRAAPERTQHTSEAKWASVDAEWAKSQTDGEQSEPTRRDEREVWLASTTTAGVGVSLRTPTRSEWGIYPPRLAALPCSAVRWRLPTSEARRHAAFFERAARASIASGSEHFLPKVTTAATATRSAKKGYDHHRSYGYVYLILGHYFVRRLAVRHGRMSD